VTVFDYVVLFILGCSVLVGTLRGLVREVLSLLGWIVAFLVASTWCDQLAPLLPAVIPGGTARLVVAFVALFFGIKLLAMLLTMTLDALLKASGLVVVDRGLGSLFGLARGAVIVLAGVLVCGTTALPRQAFWKEAMLSPLAETAARSALPLLPGEFGQHVKF
jgi:membrane protein required for colicin V production